MKHSLGIWISTIATILLVSYYFVLSAPPVSGSYRMRFDLYTIGLILAIASLMALFVLILRTKAKNASVTWFSAMVSLCIFWVFDYLMWAWSANPQTAVFWQHLLAFFWVPLPIIFLLFVLSYTTDEGALGHPLIWASLPVTFGLLVYLVGYGNLIYVRTPIDPVQNYWGIESAAGTHINLSFLWLTVVAVVSFIILTREYFVTNNTLRKKQLRIFIFALGVAIFFGILFDVVLYGLNVRGTVPFTFPPMSFAYTSAMAFIMGYGIIRYGIFKVNPAALSGTILENLSEAVVAVNNSLEIEFTNKGVEQISGYEEKTLTGQHLSLLFDSDVFQQITDLLGGSGAKRTIEDIDLKNKEGKEVSVALSLDRVYDERHRPAGYIFVFANITELKRKTIELAEQKESVEQKVRERTQELSEERARLSASINSLKLGYIMTGQNGEIIVMNPAAEDLLTKLAEVQKMPRPEGWNLEVVQKIFHAGADLLDPISKTRVDRKPFEFKEVQIKDHFLYVFVAPVTERNEVIGSVVLFEDITDEKALNRSKDEFFVIASHELRTPLTKIRGSAELMMDVYKTSITNDDALKMLHEIETSSAHLIDIVNVIIEISELEQKKVILKPAQFDLILLIKEVVSESAKKAANPDIHTSIVSSLEKVEITADRDRTRQIIKTFVDNAFKFTPRGEITISVKPEGRDVRVRIADTGKGIVPENQGLLFRKFQQAGTSLLSRDGEGTGLGLYVVRLLLDIMGGVAGLEQSQENHGSTFFFTIPITQPPQKQNSEIDD